MYSAVPHRLSGTSSRACWSRDPTGCVRECNTSVKKIHCRRLYFYRVVA